MEAKTLLVRVFGRYVSGQQPYASVSRALVPFWLIDGLAEYIKKKWVASNSIH